MESEKIASHETDITNIKEDIREIKHMLSDHVSWESDKYEKLEKKFASKWVESVIIFLVGGTALTMISFFLYK